MRNLLILVASQLQGKSTWIEQNGLQEYTLSMDTLRSMYLPKVGTIEGKVTLPGDKNDIVFKTFIQMLESRMNSGSFVILDNMNNRESDLTFYKNLCQIYGYKMWFKDFRNTHSLDQCLQINELRSGNYLPKESIELHYELAEKLVIHKNITEIYYVNEIPDYEGVKFIKLHEKYKSVYYIGDIHGCIDALKSFVENHYSLDCYYVFTGDYVDRGPDSAGVMTLLKELHLNGNVTLLEGNHEKWVRLWSVNKEDMIKNKGFLTETMPSFRELDSDSKHKFTKSDARSFVKKLRIYSSINFAGKNLFACHGGVNRLNISTSKYKSFHANQYINGTGNYSNVLSMYLEEPKVTEQDDLLGTESVNIDKVIHGHRNRSKVTHEGKYVNLEGSVEEGGLLKCFKVNLDGSTEDIHIKSEYSYLTDGKVAMSEFRNSPHIKESTLTPYLSAINFTRELFYKRSWSRTTVKARGLFVNTISNTVEARSYDKFFNIGELDETKLPKLKNCVYPLDAFEKGNGYLGITSNNSITGELLVCSKTTNKGEYADNFRRMLEENVNLDILNHYCKHENVSLVFEVVDPIFDPHIVPYPKEELILLDVIPNSFVYSTWEYKKLTHVLNLIKTGDNIRVKRLEKVINTFDELLTHMFDNKYSKSEGFVYRDQKGFMFKYKTSFYSFLKLVRGHIERCEKEDTSSLPFNSLMGAINDRGLFTDNVKDSESSIISKAEALKFLSFVKTEVAFGNYNIIDIYLKYKEINEDFLEPLKP